MKNQYDVIVVGAGHNGLTCAGYLARAGRSVIVLERRNNVGGLCTEYEFFPGYTASLPNSPGSLEPKVVQDLELTKYGLEFTPPNPSLLVPFPDGRAMVAWRDREKTNSAIAQFSQKDVAGYTAFFEYLNDFAQRLGISLFEPPPRLADVIARLKTPKDELDFSKIVLGSLQDLLDEWLESEELKSVIGAISATSNMVGPKTPGSAYLLLMRPLSLASSSVSAVHDPRKQYLRGSTGLPIGGMGAVTKAMQASFEDCGGIVRTDASVKKIIADAGRVQGVELDGGEIIRASTVVSNLHPKTTLQDLLESEHLDDSFLDQVSKLPKRGSAFKLALALDDVPRFLAAPKGLEKEYASCQFRIAPSLDYQERAFDDAKYGAPSTEPIILGLTPSITSPNMAPEGKHIMSCNVWHAPVELKNASWSVEGDKMALRCIEILKQYIPNLNDIISNYKFLTPLDLENEFGLRDANIMHLDVLPSHMFGLRPLPGWSSYSMPVSGLFLCGSGTWPGGTVSGVPGFNASQQILEKVKD